MKPGILICCLLLAGSAFAQTMKLTLKYVPTDSISKLTTVDLTGCYEKLFAVSVFEDKRENKSEIGKSSEYGRTRLVTTTSDVGQWCQTALSSILNRYGLKAAPDSQHSDITIHGEVKTFYVVETSTYEANISLHIRVLDDSSKTLWEGIVNGSGSHWGRSFKAQNYLEILSNTYLDAVHSLLSNDNFRKAVCKKP